MPKRKRKAESCGPKKKQNRASSGLNAHKKRTDPFTLLPWDCASIVLQYLDIRDLACCEQLSKGWRSFVQHWLVVAGHQYCLPDGWRPDIPNPITYEDALAAVKKSVVEYAAFRKLASGSASCGRRYQTCDTGVFDTSGNFTVWHTGDAIFYQKLGFREDGSLYPVQRLSWRVTGDNLRYLAVNSDGYLYLQICRPNNHPVRPEEFRQYVFALETGERLWKRRASPNSNLFALGRKRIYLVGTDLQNRHLTAHDIRSGKLLYEVPFPHPVYMSKPPIPVQQPGGDEAIIHIDAVPPGRSISSVDGIQVINGKDGTVVQTIPTRIWCHGSQIIPQTGEQGGFAILSHHRTSHWYVKIQKFSQDAETGAFRSNSTEILDLGQYPDQIRQIGIEPYRYLAVSLEGRRVLPRTRMIQEAQSPTIDARGLPADGATRIDRWLCLEPGQEVTLPQKYKHHRARRLFIPGPLDYDPDSCRLNFAGWDRFVLFTEPRQFYCLFDFAFRVPSNMPSNLTPDPMTLEMR